MSLNLVRQLRSRQGRALGAAAREFVERITGQIATVIV
jgi:hypothetical protein